MEINMTAALTKSISSSGLHRFPSSYGVSAYRHYEDVLVFSYGEYNCLRALAPCSAKIREKCCTSWRTAPAEATRWRRWCLLSPDTIDLWLLMCRHCRPRGSPLLTVYYVGDNVIEQSSFVNVETVWEVVVVHRGPPRHWPSINLLCKTWYFVLNIYMTRLNIFKNQSLSVLFPNNDTLKGGACM